MTELSITALYTYPIKSCGALKHAEIVLDSRGFRYDRQWMVVRDSVTERGLFVTQRELPRMALIQPHIDGDHLSITAPGMPPIAVPLTQRHPATLDVTVWRDTIPAADQGDVVAQWFSNFLGTPVRLVRFDDDTVRAVSMNFTDQPAQTGFADGYPLLLASEASLADLNVRLGIRSKQPVPMSRFRPNIVVGGGTAWQEDDWKWISINGVRYEVAKPCARCAITTVDPARGEVAEKGEPLATLETFRRGTGRVSGVLFGQNVIHRGLGEVRLGDSVEVLSFTPA